MKSLPSHEFEEAPIPLLRPRTSGRALPLDELGSIRAPVEAIAALTAAPVEIAFQSVLGGVALASQHIADVETLGGSAPLSLFLLTVAASGERKSACDHLASRAFLDWEEVKAGEFERQRQSYAFEETVYEDLKRKAVKARTSDDAVVDATLPEPPRPPITPRKLLSDITFEGVLRHFEDGDPSIGIFADEGGQFFGGHGMNSDNQLKTATGLSKLWDAAPLNRTRAGAPHATFRHRRGSLHLMIQPRIAEDVLRNEALKDQGLMSRMLVAWPKSRIGLRRILTTDEEAEKRRHATDTVEKFQDRLTELLRHPAETGHNPLELKPRLLTLDPDARVLLTNFANQVEAAQAPYQSLAHITGFASKAAEQAARIAGVLAIFTDENAASISYDVMRSGVATASWYITEAQRLLDAGPVDKGLAQAQILLDWLIATHPDRPFDKRTIVRKGPSAIRDTKTVERLLAVLVEYSHILHIPAGAEIDGHIVRQAWEVNANA